MENRLETAKVDEGAHEIQVRDNSVLGYKVVTIEWKRGQDQDIIRK